MRRADPRERASRDPRRRRSARRRRALARGARGGRAPARRRRPPARRVPRARATCSIARSTRLLATSLPTLTAARVAPSSRFAAARWRRARRASPGEERRPARRARRCARVGPSSARRRSRISASETNVHVDRARSDGARDATSAPARAAAASRRTSPPCDTTSRRPRPGDPDRPGARDGPVRDHEIGVEPRHAVARRQRPSASPRPRAGAAVAVAPPRPASRTRRPAGGTRRHVVSLNLELASARAHEVPRRILVRLRPARGHDGDAHAGGVYWRRDGRTGHPHRAPAPSSRSPLPTMPARAGSWSASACRTPPAETFQHALLPAGDPLRTHVVYRLTRPARPG